MKTLYEVVVVVDHGAEESDALIRHLLAEHLDGAALDAARKLTGLRVASIGPIDRIGFAP